MKTAAKTLWMTGFAVVTMIILLALSVPAKKAAPPAVEALSPVPAAALSTQAQINPSNDTASTKYFFNVHNHSADEFRTLLARAGAIYNETAAEKRKSLEVVMVLHGPDIDFFDRNNHAEYQDIVDAAAQLDAYGVFDFKVCRATAAMRGVAREDVPAFIEFVPYGPREIARLEEAGYVRL